MKRFLFIELCAFTKVIEGIYIIVTVDTGYCRSSFNCEYLLIANCEFFYVSQLIDSQT